MCREDVEEKEGEEEVEGTQDGRILTVRRSHNLQRVKLHWLVEC